MRTPVDENYLHQQHIFKLSHNYFTQKHKISNHAWILKCVSSRLKLPEAFLSIKVQLANHMCISCGKEKRVGINKSPFQIPNEKGCNIKSFWRYVPLRRHPEDIQKGTDKEHFLFQQSCNLTCHNNLAKSLLPRSNEIHGLITDWERIWHYFFNLWQLHWFALIFNLIWELGMC